MKKVLGRVLIVLPAIILQIAWYVLIMGVLNNLLGGHLGDIVSVIFTILAIIFVTELVVKRDESSYKLLWVILIVAFPVFGAILYFFVGNKKTGRVLKKKLEESMKSLPVPEDKASKRYLEDIKKDDLRLGQTLAHVSESTRFPVYKNGTSKYYPLGEDMFVDMIEDLKKAKSYIYVEYFIIQSGKFWDTLTDIMAEKARAGVDVRVMYDDLGCIATYSADERAALEKKGIKFVPFNPFFMIKTQLNNRDHRKIMVIDGKIAYSGGVNIADEYINEKVVYGKWKDIGFRITGEAVMSYAYMFVEFWNAFSDDKIEITDELVNPGVSRHMMDSGNGFILPYYDSPMREEHTSNELFTEILSSATDYVWFYTPYLILGDALYDAFIRAAKRGVDVRIMMPGIPDKKMVYRLSRSYYDDLLKAGVKVFEYDPGFIHAKAFIADDKVAGIGTVNLDYRSLFLHFECNAIFYKADIIEDLKRDLIDAEKQSTERFIGDVQHSAFYRFGNKILRLIAPLL